MLAIYVFKEKLQKMESFCDRIMDALEGGLESADDKERHYKNQIMYVADLVEFVRGRVKDLEQACWKAPWPPSSP